MDEHPSLETVTEDNDLETAWELLADVCINEEDEIDRDFLYWKKGTDRQAIWNWFDQKHSMRVGYLNKIA